MSKEWNAKNEAERKPFQDKADEDKRRYQAEKKAYDEKKAAEGGVQPKTDKAVPKKKPTKPKEKS